MFLGFTVKMSSSHSGTNVARWLFNIENRFEYRYRYSQQSRIMLNYFSVFQTISGIHNQEYQIEYLLFLQFLKKLCHQHKVFSTGNTYSNLVPILNHIIGFHSFCKWGKQFFMPGLLDTLQFFRSIHVSVCMHYMLVIKICTITKNQSW